MIDYADNDMTHNMYFSYTDADGTVNTKQLSMETWVEGLDHFVRFLKGCGFYLDYDSVGVNTNKHIFIQEDYPTLTSFDPSKQ